MFVEPESGGTDQSSLQFRSEELKTAPAKGRRNLLSGNWRLGHLGAPRSPVENRRRCCPLLGGSTTESRLRVGATPEPLIALREGRNTSGNM